MAMLELSNLCKSFGDLRAVDDLSLTIETGEVFGLLGPNGAGKTTTIHMATGLLVPDSGTVVLNGQGSPTDPKVRANIGVAPQALSLYEELTGQENLDFFGSLQGLSGKALAQRVDASLEFVSLADRRKDLVKNYSGGMKRRLNIAVALIHEPRIVLLDEPTVGVDPQSRNAIFDNILELKARGVTIVYTTHYMEEAEKLCDRVAIMDNGKILALDSLPSLIKAHGGQSVVVLEGEDGEERIETDHPLDELVKRQGESGLASFRVERPNLERVFLNLTGRHLRD